MQRVEGRIFWNPALPDVSTEDRGKIYAEMNRALAKLATTAPGPVGLGDFGRPGSYTLVTEDYETDSITHATRMGTTSLSTST